MRENMDVFLKSQQFLISQIFHDFVSPMSALFVAAESLSEGDNEIMSILNKSSLQTRSILMLFRAIFGYGALGIKEGGQYIKEYIEQNTYITTKFRTTDDDNAVSTQILMVACLWVSKQSMLKSGEMSIDVSENFIQIVLSNTRVSIQTSEDKIILGKPTYSNSLKESYACYISQILSVSGFRAQIERSKNSLSLKVFS